MVLSVFAGFRQRRNGFVSLVIQLVSYLWSSEGHGHQESRQGGGGGGGQGGRGEGA